MEITPSLLALQLVTGIALGAVYALLAIGLSLIFGMLTVVNFAHGAFFMVGAFIGLYFMGLTGNFWFSLVLTPLVVGALGLVTERFLVRPLYGRGIDYPLLLTFGLSWVLIEAMRVMFGIEGIPSSTPPELRGAVDLGIGFFPKYRLFLIFATAVVVLALWLFLEKTRYGLIVRAGSRDGEICKVLGIDIARVWLVVFGIGTAIAGLSGVLAAPTRAVNPEMGIHVLAESFVQHDPGIDLSSFGMPGCRQYLNADVTSIMLLNGGTGVYQQSLPNSNSMLGVQFLAQSFVFAPGANATGVIASNGMRLVLGR